MNFKKYQESLNNVSSLQYLLVMAFLSEDGIIDYAKFLQDVANLSKKDADVLARNFAEDFPPIKLYPAIKQHLDNGKSFEEILTILEEKPDPLLKNWFFNAYLMMKLFNLTYDEFTTQRAKAHGFIGALSQNEILKMNIFDNIGD